MPSGMILYCKLSSEGWQRRILTKKGFYSTKTNKEKRLLLIADFLFWRLPFCYCSWLSLQLIWISISGCFLFLFSYLSLIQLSFFFANGFILPLTFSSALLLLTLFSPTKFLSQQSFSFSATFYWLSFLQLKLCAPSQASLMMLTFSTVVGFLFLYLAAYIPFFSCWLSVILLTVSFLGCSSLVCGDCQKSLESLGHKVQSSGPDTLTSDSWGSRAKPAHLENPPLTISFTV